jgi:hypothetical protein
LENGLKNAFPKVVIEAFSNPEINDMTEPWCAFLYTVLW